MLSLATRFVMHQARCLQAHYPLWRRCHRHTAYSLIMQRCCRSLLSQPARSQAHRKGQEHHRKLQGPPLTSLCYQQQLSSRYFRTINYINWSTVAAVTS